MSEYQQLKDIRVYVMARNIGARVWDQVNTWDYFARRTVGQQLVRAVDSIGANIAESYGRHHARDVVLYLYYARGSLYETEDWLSKAVQRKLLPDDLGREPLDEIKALAPKLNAYIRSKSRRRTTQPPNHLILGGRIWQNPRT